MRRGSRSSAWRAIPNAARGELEIYARKPQVHLTCGFSAPLCALRDLTVSVGFGVVAPRRRSTHIYRSQLQQRKARSGRLPTAVGSHLPFDAHCPVKERSVLLLLLLFACLLLLRVFVVSAVCLNVPLLLLSCLWRVLFTLGWFVPRVPPTFRPCVAVGDCGHSEAAHVSPAHSHAHGHSFLALASGLWWWALALID